ncbi:hypothetical protein R1sor_010008 [Riccia sorocarpa]|uniref:Endonuclease/exonuclease/phosphatase n=1 Tax=Riccia sorocarpa TaxID=122646 RepID=A0ABD3HZG9_9MARC
MDADGTPDKGNQTKRRPPPHQNVDTFSQLVPKRLEWNTVAVQEEEDPPDRGRNDNQSLTITSILQKRSQSPERDTGPRPEPGEENRPGTQEFSDRQRVDTVRKWMRKRNNKPDIVVLQEIMTNGREVSRALDSIMPGATVVEDRKADDTIDTVLLLSRKLQVRDRGCSSKGFAFRAKIETSVGVVGIMGVHAPREKREKAWL